MDLATGAMDSLLPKLAELLNEEYKLQKGIKEGIRSLEKEMKSMHAALRVVGEVPCDQLDELVKLWAGEVRELSFDMEDVVDKFLVRVDDSSEPATKSNKLKRLTEKMAGLFTKGKARHEIADAIKEINKQVQEISNRRGRYTIDNIIAKPATATPIDPRLGALYTDVAELVGIAGKRDQELMKILSEGDDETENKLKIVSVVGFGGLGKTTLVKTVYGKIKGDFDCSAFVPVGRNAGAKKVFMNILHDIGMYKSHFTDLDEKQLIDKLREGLKNRRYLIVIDDIWDEKLWKVIKWAFPISNNVGSRLITTTRIVSVAKFCCPSNNDSVYQMEPLSADDSQRLFYKRIFSCESECPREFEVLSKDILKKCGGVPLAIITIASLLASDQQVKPKDEWHVLLECIGRGLTEDPSVEEMLRILSFSYYDMPSHLKTCLLYLSMFPEDYKIRKDRLIWMWIAENFVRCDKARSCAFEIGEAYFNDLVNRNMIVPVYEYYGTTIQGCYVHDMVLDLICSLSSEDNFVTVLNGTTHSMSSRSNVRRLSLQNAIKGEVQTTPFGSVSMLQVRSIATFKPAIDLMPSFSSFVVLRLLDLSNCNLRNHDHLNLRELGSLLHLRYLGLANTGTSGLPKEIGNLQFLQVLDVSENDCIRLPSTITKLRRLMCLFVDNCFKLPDGMGSLTSLEVLHVVCCLSPSTVKELGSMERLRKLGIWFDVMSLEMEETFVESLGKMSNIQSIEITHRGEDDRAMDILGERWVAPPTLQKFTSSSHLIFSVLPAWIRLHPSQLSTLEIGVKEVRQEDLDILGTLPGLCHLSMWSKGRSRLLLISADGFRCLTSFALISDSPGQVVFQPGGMPKVYYVRLDISLQVAKEEAAGNNGDWFSLNMGNLRDATLYLYRSGLTVGEAKQGKAALEKALRTHPKCPSYEISFFPQIPLNARDDDVYFGRRGLKSL